MKILHTGDWHIGKLVHGLHMTKDQRYILNQLIALIKKEAPDVLVIAGDLYDRSIPPTEAVELLDDVFSEIIMDTETQIIAISGNHDSPDRVRFVSRILKDNGLHIIGEINKECEPIIIKDEHGVVEFYPIPFMEPIHCRALFEDDSIKSHDDVMGVITHKIHEKRKAENRCVCIAHCFALGGDNLEVSESVRPLSIGGSEYVNVDYFKDFNYVALGHLHRPQKVKYDHVRYSGSLLKYSFSEAKQKKSVTMLTLDEKGDVTYALHELSRLHDMRKIKGELKALTAEEHYQHADRDDYIMATLTDRGELVDPISQLRNIYPNILRLEKEDYDREAGLDKTSAGKEFTNKKPLELFKEFYENMSGEVFSDDKEEVFIKIVNRSLKL